MHPDGLREALLKPSVISLHDVLFYLERSGSSVDDGFDELQRMLDLRDTDQLSKILILNIKILVHTCTSSTKISDACPAAVLGPVWCGASARWSR